MRLSAHFLPALANLPAPVLDKMLAGHAEGAGYERALAAMQPGAIATRAIAVQDETGTILLAASLFELVYRLDTPLQGVARRISDKIHAFAPQLVTLSLLGVGSPYTDACPILEKPDITLSERTAAFSCLLDALEQETTRTGASLIGFKDLAPHEAGIFGDHLRTAGYARIESLPVANVEVRDIDKWLATLSKSTRKDIRRKLTHTQTLINEGQVEIEHRADLGPHAMHVHALYEQTRLSSEVGYDDFERLPTDYFDRIAEHAPARFSFYHLAGELIGFNLLLLGQDHAIDKFIGLKQPHARQTDLYVLSWVENMRFCQQTQRKYLQTGQTAYAEKLRFGSHLVSRTLYARHRRMMLNPLLHAAAPLLDFTRHDPVLNSRKQKAA